MPTKTKYILSVDLGTSSVRAMLFDSKLSLKAFSQTEIKMYYPEPGWVEQDAEEVWVKTQQVMRGALRKAKIKAEQVRAIGIANQRETTVIWNGKTGRPVARAIVWQDRRTSDQCDRLEREGLGSMIKKKTGLVIDPYFSATKARWIIKRLAARGPRSNLKFGTMDTWLIWKMTGGRVHATDVSNASRTMLFDIRKMQWDIDLLKKFGLSEGMMPMVMPSSTEYGQTERSVLGKPVMISGVCGDQQSALFGQTCFDRGDIKNTYGTGAFLLLNTGSRPVFLREPLLTTVAWQIGSHVTYALEGGVFACGSVINWLQNEFALFKDPAETGAMALSLKGNAGVHFVPAFNGLGAPYWDPEVRGAVIGLTQGTGKEHIVRAALEGIVHQTTDVIEVMRQGSGLRPRTIKVDGGVSKNDFLLQYQADMAGVAVARPRFVETTALGAAMLAGLSVGVWSSQSKLRRLNPLQDRFTPKTSLSQRRLEREHWKQAVKTVQSWK